MSAIADKPSSDSSSIEQIRFFGTSTRPPSADSLGTQNKLQRSKAAAAAAASKVLFAAMKPACRLRPESLTYTLSPKGRQGCWEEKGKKHCPELVEGFEKEKDPQPTIIKRFFQL